MKYKRFEDLNDKTRRAAEITRQREDLLEELAAIKNTRGASNN